MRKDWIVCKLGDFVSIISGNAFKKSEYSDSGVRLFQIANVSFNKTTWEKTAYLPITYLTDEKYKHLVLDRGDIVMALNRPMLNKKLKISQLSITDVPSILYQRVGKFDISEEIYPKYLLYYFQSPLFTKWLSEELQGVNIPFINQSKLLAFSNFPFTPLPIQRAIVSKIETLFSDLDNGIADLKKAQEQLKIYRQAVLKKAFEGELTKVWRENNSPKSSYEFLKEISEERKANKPDKGSIYHKKISPDFKFKRSDKIISWSVGTLDKLVYIAARIGWRGLKKSEYTENGPLFLSVHSLNHGKYVDYSEAFHLPEERYLESPEIKLLEGDVLLCKDGAGIGKIGIIKNLESEATVNSSLLVIRGLEILNQEFIYYLFSGPALQSIVFERITGSATPHLFQNDIRKFELQIPPKEEQEQIIREIESRLSVCDKVEQSINEALSTSEALRQSILKKAFEGKLLSEAEIAQCKQEADYEPAGVLLERIKGEKKLN